MRELRRLAWAAALAALGTTPAFGQTTGTTVGSTGTNVSTVTPTTTTTTTSNAANTSTTTQTAAGGSPTTQNEIQLTPLQATPILTGVSAYSSTTANRAGTTGGVQASNFLRNVYGNPYYQGLYTSPVNQLPGGFGTALYPTTGTTGRATTGTQGGRGAAGTSTSVNVQDPGGIIANLPRQIAYPSVVKFQAPAVAPAQLQSDLASMIRQTTVLANPAGVQVAMGDGNSVVLRGAVADADEARAVEGMVRMTPGVRQIKNELTYPKP